MRPDSRKFNQNHIMKNIIAIASLLAAGTALANAGSVIFDITNSPSVSYESDSIHSVGDTQNGGSAVNFIFDGKSCSISLGTGSGANRGFLSGGANWTGGLPEFVGNDFGLSASDISTITGSAAYITGNTSGYPGIVTVTISGLAAGTYNISGLMAKQTGDTSPTTWEVSVGDQQVADFTSSYYVYSSSSWSESPTTGSSYSAVANNTPSAHYVMLDGIKVLSDNGTITLRLTGTPTSGSGMNLKSLQFLTLTSVPEPSAFGLLAGAGALALVAVRRRRQKKA